jgi:hypothetical protein
MALLPYTGHYIFMFFLGTKTPTHVALVPAKRERVALNTTILYRCNSSSWKAL